MEIRDIADKTTWEAFLADCREKSFLHSWNWGVFQESLGEKIWRLGVYQENTLVAVALVIRHHARRGSFLLVPHGPVVMEHEAWSKEQILKILLEKLKEIAKTEKVDFIRISPIAKRSKEQELLFKNLGFRLRALHSHPESSWKLDITPTEEQLLAGMRKSTRYLLRQAEKDSDLEIYQSFDPKDVELFNEMHREVVKHQKFVPFSLEYFQKEFASFLPDKEIALFIAKYQGKTIAASYGIFWSGMAFYHHAALLPEYKKVPASYLLQWTAIREAKRRGCTIYDFWGYSDPVKYPKHPYSGPTLFKMGFGGYCDEYVKTQDFPLTKKYWLNYIIETMRRIHRGL